MNRWVIAFVACAVIVLAAVVGRLSQAAQSEATPRSAADEIRNLQDERVELLSRVQKVANTKYKLAMISLAELVSCERQCLDGRLDAAQAPSQRIAVLEEFLKSFAATVKAAETSCGIISELDVDLGKALVFEARIKLLRERQAADGEKK